jgi:dihydropteroate synthase
MRAASAPSLSLSGLGERTLVMGILNVTPDSFSEQGLFFDRSAAVRHALEMEGEGADIIDIGGESTRPGHTPVDAEEEQERVIPVLRTIAPQLSVPISIDTYKASTARLAIQAGARIVNDVWGLHRDPDLAFVVAEHEVPVILMHNRMEVDPAIDILDDIRRFFDRSLDLARRAGIDERRIILDPGFGFGKTVDQSLEALRRLPEIKALGYPVLAGISRKSLVARFYDPGVPPRERLFGTIAAHVLAVHLGADIVRVHDVSPHVEACRMADGLVRGRA